VKPPLLPGPRATQLLRAMLLDGDVARDAWSQWTRGAGSAKQALATDSVMARSLLALLYDSVRRNALTADSETVTYLRSAYLTETLRTRAYRAIVEDLRARCDVPFTLIKGAVIAERHYSDPVLRHAHDIEIVAPNPVAVRNALAGSAFHAEGEHYVHQSGLPLRVHARTEVAFTTYDATSALALTLVHASSSRSRSTCRWACDAFFIVRNGDVEWSRFTEMVLDARAATPVFSQMRWLREHLGVDVPADVRSALLAKMPLWQRWFLRGAIDRS
jgi:hypothetical protein